MSKSADPLSRPTSTLIQSLAVAYCQCGVTRWSQQRESIWQVRDYDVISIVVSGGYTLEWARRSERVEAGTAAIIPAGVRRRGRLLPDCESAALAWLNPHATVMHGGMSPFGLYDTPTVIRGPIVQELLRLHAVGDALSAERSSINRALDMRRLTLDVLATVLPQLALRSDQRPTQHDLTPLLDWLDSDPGGAVTVEDMAARCELSVSRFHRVFRQETGDTPHNYLRRIRLGRAADLLRTTDLRIGDIARQLGFADQFHLSRLFKDEYGMPPTAFRRSTQVAFL